MNLVNKFFGFITRNIKNLLWILVAFIVICGVTIIAYDVTFNFIRRDAYQTYDKEGEEITIDIPMGATSKDISAILLEQGLIENEWLFRLKAKLTGADNNFQYGVYKLIKGMPDYDILDVLQQGAKAESVMITIPEGWSVRQIGAYLESKSICLQSDFEAACNRTDYDFEYYDLITGDREYLLEGYLWPDTYDVIPQNGAEGVVKRMLREFERKWESHGEWLEKMYAMGLTIDQVVTMASCIEKEAGVSSERPMVSRTLYNRMDQGMTWSLDCTVLYALALEGTGYDNVLYSDLEVDSPYNTYRNYGYPVGPIGCPGASAINAVLNPAEGDWLYYIAYEDGSGEHLFTSDYDEFLQVFNGTYER